MASSLNQDLIKRRERVYLLELKSLACYYYLTKKIEGLWVNAKTQSHVLAGRVNVLLAF